MEAQPKTMQQKKARHYPETKIVLATSLIIFGVSFMFSLVILWPQSLLVDIFNERLTFHLMVDNEDYFTCDKQYQEFVVDTPTEDFQMLSFYVFNVSNAYEVIERGDQPVVTETGPYAFVKYTYKYDVLFNDVENTITYKEFSYLNEITDPDACEKMFYRLEKDYIQDDPCGNNKCSCKSIDALITVINPLFLKIMWEDSAFDMLALYSVEVFQTQKQLLNGPFLEAVRAHMVARAYKEIYLFRIDMAVGQMLITAYNYMRTDLNLTNEQIALISTAVPDCGLAVYGVLPTVNCPLAPQSFFTSLRLPTMLDSDIPSRSFLFDPSNDIAVTNTSYGLPRFLGLAFFYGYVDFNSKAGYTMVNSTTLQLVENEFIAKLGFLQWGKYNLTENERAGCKLALQAVANQLGKGFLTVYRSNPVVIQNVYIEFNTTYEPVICAPMGEKCLYQYGYMQQQRGGSLFPLNSPLIRSLIDISTEVSTELNNFYKDLNAPRWYNVYLYYYDVLGAGGPAGNIGQGGPGYDGQGGSWYMQCTNLADTIESATFTQPAGLWGSFRSISAVNRTALFALYRQVPAAEKALYFDLATNLSTLIQRVYRNATDFHDNFVINFVNKNRDNNLTHVFTVDKFEELGIAQWAGGFTTHALAFVRTTKQIVRDGMWNFGLDKYYEYYLEYASYCVIQGFPSGWIYDMEEARKILDLLSSNTVKGLEFRRHIMYTGSTFIGDGINYENDIGDIGEITFTREANLGNFLCDDHPENAEECTILAENITSSARQCAYVQNLYAICINQFTFQSNGWIDINNCRAFETSTTSPDLGIQCDSINVFGKSHPYKKSRGNVIFQMLYTMAYKIVMWDKLWCDYDYSRSSTAICSYEKGGMFTTTKVKNVLFEGFTDPSVVKYMDLKHSLLNNISFRCVEDAYDVCGVKNYACSDAGVLIAFPNNSTFLMKYNATEYDHFFTHEFSVTDSTYNLIWPYSTDSKIETISRNLAAAVENGNVSYHNVYRGLLANSSDARYEEEYLEKYADVTEVTTFRNFFWTAYPAWNNYFGGQNEAFLKYYQCQNRILFGNINQFVDCFYEVYTGRDDFTRVLDLKRYYGNETINPFYNINYTLASNATEGDPSLENVSYKVNGSTANNQYKYYAYDGFKAYPYVYAGTESGIDHYTQE
eukprot:gene28812-34780_t